MLQISGRPGADLFQLRARRWPRRREELHQAAPFVELCVFLSVACRASATGKAPLPTQVQRVFFGNATKPRPTRSGFDFPRYDARLHDGDEIHLESVHATWLALTTDPAITLRGRNVVLRASSGYYCGTASGDTKGRFVCNHVEAPLSAWVKFVQAPERVRGAPPALRDTLRVSHMGKWCADWPDGWKCNCTNCTSDAAWLDFKVFRTSSGHIALKGSRTGQYCADKGDRGLVCDREHLGNATSFKTVTDTPLVYGVIHTKDRDSAAVFVVQRTSLNSPHVALFCKGRGNYLMAVGPEGEVSCSSPKPWTFWSSRVEWWDMKSATFQSPMTHMYVEAKDPMLEIKVVTATADASGWALWKVLLIGGYELLRPMIRGVNLGNWFLLEKWMAPGLFHNGTGNRPFTAPCVALDEHGLMNALGPEVARARMERHWATWITENDIAWLASRGINAVRVPFGYWMVFPTPPFISGQLTYLKHLFEWCERHSVSVLLDFHGLKGSQTGNPTSGDCGACGRSHCGKTRIAFLDEEDTNLRVIDILSAHFSSSPAYLGFAVANEVTSTADSKKTMEFYQKAHDLVRRRNEHALVVFFATFNPSTYPFPNFTSVAEDIHIYFGMGFGGPSVHQHENLQRMQHAVGRLHWPVLVGEWSLGGSGHPKLRPGPLQLEHFFKEFAKMQLQAYETYSSGWFYWSYKTTYPNSTWNFRDMCSVGWLPGCVKGFDYGPVEWWRAPTCSFAYLDGGCSGHRSLQTNSSVQTRWLLPVALLTLAAILVAAGIAILVVYWWPTWESARKAGSVPSEVSFTANVAAQTLSKVSWWLPQHSGWRRLQAEATTDNLRRGDLRSSQAEQRAHACVLIRKERASEQPFIW